MLFRSGGTTEGAGKIDDTVWLRVAKSLKKYGWENVSINGRMRWRLTGDEQERLCNKYGVQAGPRKSLSVIAAEVAATKAMEAAKGQKVGQTQT